MVVCNVCLSKNTTKFIIQEETMVKNTYNSPQPQRKTLPGDWDFCVTCKTLLAEGKFEELGKRAASLDKAVVDSLKKMAGSLDHAPATVSKKY